MNTISENIHKIDKYILGRVKFIKKEVLACAKKQAERTENLKKALSLGNLHRHHVNIEFYDDYGNLLQTEATVWAVTERHVILKSHLMIPIHSIAQLNLI